MSADESKQEKHPSPEAVEPQEELLFQEAMDERSLKQWEQGLEGDGAAPSQATPIPAHEETHGRAMAEAKDARTQDIWGGHGKGGAPDRKGTGIRINWSVLSARKWLRTCQVRGYGVVLVVTILAASIVSGALVAHLVPPIQGGRSELLGESRSDRAAGLRVDGLIVPIDGGEKGLMVSALVILSPGDASSRGLPGGRWLHECLYDAAQAVGSQGLSGPGGMDLLRSKMVEAIAKRRPYLRVEGIAFSEYLLL